MKLRLPVLTILVGILVILLTESCSLLEPKPAGLAEEQLGQMAADTLQAINGNDYPAFTQDFSVKMLEVFSEAEFGKLKQLLQETSGNYLSCSKPQLANNQGYAVYRFPCKFEKEDVVTTLTFQIGGKEVEGLFFDSGNLRQQINK